MVTIPFIEYPSFTEDVILDGVPYRFSFNWNDNGEFWSMIISDSNDNVLVAGIKIVIDYELIANFPGRSLPPGEMVAVDPSGTVQRISQDDFTDENVFLVYVTEDEVEQIEAGTL